MLQTPVSYIEHGSATLQTFECEMICLVQVELLTLSLELLVFSCRQTITGLSEILSSNNKMFLNLSESESEITWRSSSATQRPKVCRRDQFRWVVGVHSCVWSGFTKESPIGIPYCVTMTMLIVHGKRGEYSKQYNGQLWHSHTHTRGKRSCFGWQLN